MPDIKINIARPDLVPYQMKFLYDPSPLTVVEAATKVGKTLSHYYWLFELAHGQNPYLYTNNIKPGMNFWWIAPSYEQSHIAFKRLKLAIGRTPGYSFKNGKPYFIKTPLDSYIHFKTGDKPDALYGDDVFGAVMDEFTRQRKEAYDAVRSTLTSTNGPLKLIGNYRGPNHWGRQLLKSTNSKHFIVTAEDAVREGVMTREALESARQDYDQETFNSLYMCIGSSDKNSLYISQKINDLFTNSFIPTGYERYITADAAFGGNDKFILYVWQGNTRIARMTRDSCRHDEAITWIKSVAHQYSVPMSNVAYDVGGPGDYLTSYFEDGKPVNFGSSALKDKYEGQIKFKNLRAQMYYHSALKTNRNEYYLADDSGSNLLLEELAVIKRLQTDSGVYQIIPKSTIKSIIGRSPDDADAFVMREIFNLDESYDLNRGDYYAMSF